VLYEGGIFTHYTFIKHVKRKRKNERGKQFNLNKMETFGKVCFTLITMVITALIGGFVFQTLWGWFIVPTFTMQPMTLIQAIGTSFFINYLKMNLGKKSDDEFSMKFVLKALVMSVVMALFVLGLGWVITLFM
jgi:hypothetical protein